ncbi:putative methylcrotonoyl-CoA carboxylase beta chain, mitochondrial [Neolecta irregularis DAH-3]|uniref:methylcrotonoyl-CoA carboxylase n=1 Tax=Neolecta irregularis (strain DAH-3) TaxID=1198029 RepID=A0A1U7LGN3_NEOID|nr:putative methylcrotonoyl-CoA carboxylase beta chain, mitochondrial [Neolecta irregularis DAH-3]|eukprot:OLL21815.1 putative methylcrotonoyl-CoA carboxylase beta chain, mitochondrial [Neolecta irregularis DAH-3]
MVTAHIPTLDGGAWKPISTIKTKRICKIAAENDLPMISMVQSAGVSLPHQFRVFHSGGELFKDLAQRSGQGTPTCSVVMGSSTAGGAYQPGMSDYTILVKNQAQVFLGGPPLVKMATGEITDAESLGGADMHSRESGLSDQLAMDEFEAILKARQWILTINRENHGSHRVPKLRHVLPPIYDSDELLGIVSADIKHPFDMQEVISRIVDDSRVELFKPLYGKNLNPVILSHEAHKGTQFIRLCNNSNTPIIFLHNVSGFMVGKKTEKEGLIKAGSLFVNAVSNSKVPHLSIVCGASYGAGNYAMCGRPYDPRFLFSWPNSRCSVMGPEQLTGVMEHIAREGAAKAGHEIDEKALRVRSEGFRKRVEADGDVYYTSAHMLDDGIVDPRDTRNVLGMCLDIVYNVDVKGNPGFRGISRM